MEEKPSVWEEIISALLDDDIDRVEEICDKHLPSGSGIDRGVEFQEWRPEDSTLVLSVPWHWMDDNGFYRGWSEFTAEVRPDQTTPGDIVVDVKYDRDEEADWIDDICRDFLEGHGIFLSPSLTRLLRVSDVDEIIEGDQDAEEDFEEVWFPDFEDIADMIGELLYDALTDSIS